MNREELISILRGIDEEASLLLGCLKYTPHVVIVGGAAFFLRDLTDRSTTHDIDVLNADSVIREIISGYPQINGGVAAYMDQIPYNFEDRLVPLEIGTTTIRFVTPSVEDLIVMKLYAERPNDLQDIHSAAQKGSVNWVLLEHLVYDDDEAKASTNIKRRYNEMVGAFERFKKEWKNESDI